MTPEGDVLVRNDLLFVTRDEVIEQDRPELPVTEMVLVHVTEKEGHVIPEEAPRARHEEGAAFEILVIRLQVLRKLRDVFLDHPGLIKPFP